MNRTNTLFKDDLALGTQTRVADLHINIHGDIEEIHHNVPRSIRGAVMSYIDDIFEAIEQWINIEKENKDD